MAVSRDTEKGTWTSQIWVEDWQGKKNIRKSVGLRAKKSLGMEAQYAVSIKNGYEHEAGRFCRGIF